VIYSGSCKQGADAFAELLADILAIPNTNRLWFPADWNRYGRGAGLRRNTDIAKSSDVLIACVAADRTGGTEDTIKKFKRLGKTNLILV